MAEARYKRELRTAKRVKRALNFYLNFTFSRQKMTFTPEQGKRMKLVREFEGLTQAKMGKKMGISQSMCCRLEAGEIEIIPLTIQQFRDEFPDHFHWVLEGGMRMWPEKKKPIVNVWMSGIKKAGSKLV